MIVVATNVIAYLFIQGDRTAQAEEVLNKDADWVAPYLWRSEFRNILALYIRQGHITFSDAKSLMQQAEALLKSKEYEVKSDPVLGLAQVSKCSAYDCEFVSLAQQLSVKLVTSDTKILSAFPNLAVSMEAFTL